MARLAPFERSPTVAVAVSGGRDSLSLTLLASRWAARQGGDLMAITVDHGLRPESAAEAQQVGDWLAAYGIRHHVLRWQGPYPVSGIQAAAREARYSLMTDFCRDKAILHLLVGHHREDQAETVSIRRERSSGSAGLAAMAAISERADVRLLRPLLDVPRERLAATLAVARQSWIEDPSNDNLATARGRLRRRADALSSADALALGHASARERIQVEGAGANLAARALRFHPAGFVAIDRFVLTSMPSDIVEWVLARTTMAVAGRAYPPRRDRTRRLREALANTAEFSDRTLGGCRLIGHRNLVYVCREVARIAPALPLVNGAEGVWDNRFRVSVTKSLGEGAELGALTGHGWAQIVAADSRLKNTSMPYAARLGLPALWQRNCVVAVPHLGFVNQENEAVTQGLRLRWSPPQAVAPALFGKV